MPRDGVEDRGRTRLAGQKQTRGADGERKYQRIADSVGEEQLWNGKADVVRCEAENMLRIGGGRVGHVVMQMHDALRPARRSRRIHPEGHVVAAGLGRREFARLPRQKLVRRQEPLRPADRKIAGA